MHAPSPAPLRPSVVGWRLFQHGLKTSKAALSSPLLRPIIKQDNNRTAYRGSCPSLLGPGPAYCSGDRIRGRNGSRHEPPNRLPTAGASPSGRTRGCPCCWSPMPPSCHGFLRRNRRSVQGPPREAARRTSGRRCHSKRATSPAAHHPQAAAVGQGRRPNAPRLRAHGRNVGRSRATQAALGEGAAALPPRRRRRLPPFL